MTNICAIFSCSALIYLLPRFPSATAFCWGVAFQNSSINLYLLRACVCVFVLPLLVNSIFYLLKKWRKVPGKAKKNFCKTNSNLCLLQTVNDSLWNMKLMSITCHKYIFYVLTCCCWLCCHSGSLLKCLHRRTMFVSTAPPDAH